MNRKINLITLIGILVVFMTAMQTNINAQQLLLNEVEIDPPSTTSNACQYTEVRGTPGAVVPANTYFLSVNSDGANFGFANQVVNFGGQTVGTNGTITLFNNGSGACANRVFPTGTTLLSYFSQLSIGIGSETYLIVRSTTALSGGSDLDANDDFVLDPSFGITILDGFALIVNPEEEAIYGTEVGVTNISNTISLDQPDAVSRFANNTNPLVAAAFYFGELAPSPDETTTYAAPLSPNFPTGGMLTPGAPNVGSVSSIISEARADFDGDGRTDLSVFRPSEGNWYVNRSTAGFLGIKFGQAGDVIVPGDYDNDNRADFAVRRGQNWFILTSGTLTVTSFNFGLETDIPVPGDYDGDGDTDVAVFRPSNGTWYTSTSPVNNYGAFQYGQSGDVPVQGDYDGDGRTDRAVYRAGTWFINRSTAGMTAVRFGLTSDLPVPADYDGDGRDDITVFRPSEGFWYSLRSTTGTVFAVRFGQSGDVPVPGDYDGDGRDDQAIFRNGLWAINRSTAGIVQTQFGAANDEAVPNGYIP